MKTRAAFQILKKPFLILLFVSLSCPVLTYAADTSEYVDYKYVDEEGNDISLPDFSQAYSQSNPGPWKEAAQSHLPEIKIHNRESGLEDVRILNVTIPHPMNSSTEGSIQRIYILEKDNLIIGHKQFTVLSREAKTTFKLNGNVNFIQIYVVCSKHGVWKTTVNF